jgi:hypothetical protein
MPSQHGTVEERLRRQSELNAETGCIEWTGRVGHKGYAQIRVGDRRPVAHRVAWELERGPIPEGMVIDHLCRNRRCINVDHLEVVTPQENTLRGNTRAAYFVGRETCEHGHPWTPENTYKRKAGGRECKACNLIRGKAAREARRAKSA